MVIDQRQRLSKHLQPCLWLPRLPIRVGQQGQPIGLSCLRSRGALGGQALEEPPSRPWRDLLRLLRADGLLAPVAMVTALLLAAGGLVVEALLFRGFFDLGRELGLAG